MMASLQHCLTLFHQQEDVRVVQLKQEQEKCRVLEEALNVLAKEHNELEQSVANHISETGSIPRSFSIKSSRIFDTDDEYFDADFNEDSDTDTLVQTTESIFNTPSGSVLTLLEDHVSEQQLVKDRRRGKRKSPGRSNEHCDSTSSTESSSSSSSSTGTSSSGELATQGSSQQPSTSSYYTQACESGDHEENHRLVPGDGDEEGGVGSARGKHSDHSGSNSSSDTLVDTNTMSNATSCATLVSEGGDVYKCARDDGVLYMHRGEKEEKDLICLKTPVKRR